MNSKRDRRMTEHVFMLAEAANFGDRTAQLSLDCLADLVEIIDRLKADLERADKKQPKQKKARRRGSKVIDFAARKAVRTACDAD